MCMTVTIYVHVLYVRFHYICKVCCLLNDAFDVIIIIVTEFLFCYPAPMYVHSITYFMSLVKLQIKGCTVTYSVVHQQMLKFPASSTS